MSDEERQAIEYLKRHIIPYYGRKGTIEFMLNDTLLNLIEKQQKEMEELKEERKKYPIAMNDEQYKKVIELAQKDIKEELDRQINVRIVNEEFIENNFISKDKIKAKVKEIKDRPVKDEFITATQGKLDTIIDIESLLNEEE